MLWMGAMAFTADIASCFLDFALECPMFLNFLELPFQVMLLGMEAQAVIGLRMSKIADGGPAAMLEAHRMVTEKVSALAEAAGTLMGGGTTQTVVRRYRSHVQANEARLLGLVPGLS
jgi:hypothetical protein